MIPENTDNSVPARKLERQLYGLILVALVLLALFFALSRSVGLLGEFELPKQVDARYFFGAIACQLVFLAVAGRAWQQAISIYSDVKLPLLQSVGQISLVLIGKYIPGKVWGFIIRGKDLTNRGVSGHQMLMSNYAEQLVSIHAGLVFGGCGWLLSTEPDYWEVIFPLLLFSVFLAPVLNNRFALYVVRLLKLVFKNAHVQDCKIPYSAYLRLFFLYLLEWVFIGAILLCLYLMVFEGGAHTSAVLYIPSMNSLAFIVGFFAFFSPAGLGVRDGVLVALLNPVTGLTEAVYIAVLFRFWLVIVEALVGLCAVNMLITGTRSSQ